MAKREINGFIVVKHNSFDKVTKEHKLTLHSTFLDKEQEKLVADNLNFTVDDETKRKLLNILQFDELNERTPLYIRIWRPEEQNIEAWEKLAYPDEVPQSTLPEGE